MNKRGFQNRTTQRSENDWRKKGRKMIFAKMPFLEWNSICPFEVDVIFNAISETKTNKTNKWIGACTGICHLQWKKNRRTTTHDKDKGALRQVWLRPESEGTKIRLHSTIEGAASSGSRTHSHQWPCVLPDQKILLLKWWNQYLISDKVNSFLISMGLADAPATERKIKRVCVSSLRRRQQTQILDLKELQIWCFFFFFWSVNLALVKCTLQIRGYQMIARLLQLCLMNLRSKPKQPQICTTTGG